jgi:hypothetical protein
MTATNKVKMAEKPIKDKIWFLRNILLRNFWVVEEEITKRRVLPLCSELTEICPPT